MHNSNMASMVGLKLAASTFRRRVGPTTETARHLRQLSGIVGDFGDQSKSSTGFLSQHWKSLLGGAVVGSAVGQYIYGHNENFYEYRFVVDASPDDLADFYGSEQFMDLYCVIPFMGTLMMRGGTFDDEGVVHTTGLPGEMQVSMVFSDSEEDQDERGDDAEDGEKAGPPLSDPTGRWFNKRERFKDVFLGFTCWDMVTNFGFETLPDGRTMIFHHGEYFKGNIPPISLIVRLVFSVHARWVAWATEHHINHYAFKNETEFDEMLEEESRADMPLFLLKNYAWKDLMAVLFGRKLEEPSFLIKRSQEEAAKLKPEEVEEEEETMEETKDGAAIVVARNQVEMEALSKEHELPVQKPSVRRHITLDIKMDRRNSKISLGSLNDGNDDGADEDTLARRASTNDEKALLQRRFTTAVALDRYATVNRTLASKVAIQQSQKGDEVKEAESRIQRQVTQLRDNLGGNAAWEALRSTNNPESYKAATVAAKDRFLQRRATAFLRRQASGLLEKQDVRTLAKKTAKATRSDIVDSKRGEK